MKKAILKIEGMSCSACSNGLEKYLQKQAGIKSASVNLVMATASITYDDKLTIHDLEKFVEEAGFKSLGEEEKIKKEEKDSITPYIILGVLEIFIMALTMQHMIKIPIPRFLDSKHNPICYAIVLWLLTIPYIIFGKNIIKSGIKNIIHKMPNMDTLITIGFITSFLYSTYGVIRIIQGNVEYVHLLYLESTSFMIYFMKLGRFITEKSKNKTKDAIKELVTITPNNAHLKKKESYVNITLDEVKVGDILITLPGEKVSVDGTITKGKSSFDESFITGESIPNRKTIGDKVIAGSINYDSVIEYEAERIGKDSTISEIVRLVVEATNTKASISRIADKVCSYFVPCVIGIAFITLLGNIIFGNSITEAITRMVTVLVVACPCSLGLATPLALVVSIGNSAKKGILIKDGEILEEANKIDTIIFDKTGTLTNGCPSLSVINNHCDMEKEELLNILVSIEQQSTHPIAVGIQKVAKENNIKPNKELEIENLPGYGIKAKDNQTIYYTCNSSLLKKLDIINSYEEEEKKMTQEGNSVIYMVKNKKVIATVGLKDSVRPCSKKLIQKLKNKNIEIIMLSGDNKITTEKIANQLGIENALGEMTPDKKTKFIKQKIQEGKKVMMVGDGINDAPSLSTANIGVSISGGTDIATNSANIVLMNNNLLKIEDIFDISNKTIKNIKQNLFWAFIYNICMIPVATGIIPFIKINPMIACMAMILSSLTVTINALRLKK